ncbi:acyl carrier protein [Clostridium polynesiense]|uniref:acyl carrier protein n=1 Tax=Clostridium polynesiense TaxID=1325933 RepID=UPI0006934407|nr:acyl carrier protein [Clostridium polynesiense]
MIRKTIIEFVEVDEETITEETNFLQDLNLNSYDFANIVGKMEEALGIEIPDRDLRKLETVGDVKEYILKKLQ